jgi:nitrile hydratase
MNGAHDMGGRMGFGPILAEKNEPVFHEPWEGRVLAMSRALGRIAPWNNDEDRFACENRSPGEYLRLSYYEIWLCAMERLLVEKGLAASSEIESGRASAPKPLSPLALRPASVLAGELAVHSCRRPTGVPARFAMRDRVRARIMNPVGHTRLPRYLRGRAGEVFAVHGGFVFPDSNVHGRGEDPKCLYTVRFSAAELWGAASGDFVHAQLWEPYLEPA